MFSKLREVLLTQYIGAFLIALLVWQAAVELVTRIVRIGYWFYYTPHPSMFAEYSREQFHWDGVILSIVRGAMYLLVAYALGRWLYPPESSRATDKAEPPHVDAPREP